MPATSDKQQTAARIALAIKKGKVKPKKGSASAQMAKGMSKEQIKHFTVKEGEEEDDEGDVGPTFQDYKTTAEYQIGRQAWINKQKKKAAEKKKEMEKKKESIGEKAVSDKQRAFLNARFGHAWTKRHHFDNPGELPTYAHGGKTTSPETKAAFNKKKAKKKEKTEETTTSVNIGPGPSTVRTPKSRLVTPHSKVTPAKPKLDLRPKPTLLKKKKKTPPLKAVRSYTGREMADATRRVMQMVTEFETERDQRRANPSRSKYKR